MNPTVINSPCGPLRDIVSSSSIGYALVGEDGELLRLDDVRALNARADVGMHQYLQSSNSVQAGSVIRA
jgi:hypothetical protein